MTSALLSTSSLVAEKHDGVAEQKPSYLGARIRLKSLKGWMFGIQRSMRPASEIAQTFEHFQRMDEWQPSGERLRVGPLIPRSTQFVPADSTESAPWSDVLENNFWSVCHIVRVG